MIEKVILNSCVDQLLLLPTIKNVKIKEIRDDKQKKNFDFQIEVVTETGIQNFLVEVKGALKRPIPAHLLYLKEVAKIPILLMSKYVNPSIANDLKKNEINYIDSRGNSYIYIPGKIYVEVQGKKPRGIKEKKTTVVFQPKGLQLLYILLINDNAVNSTYRVLAEDVGISLDRISLGFTELKEKGFIRKISKEKYRIKNKKELFEQWIINYKDRLRPKLILGSYKAPPSIWDRILENMHTFFRSNLQPWAVGGSYGADLLIHYYAGKSLELWIRPENLAELTKSLKILPAEKSNITFFNLFSPSVIGDFEDIQFPVCHPLLIYAELLYRGQDRDIETAKIIYKKYLEKKFSEA